MPWFRKLFSRPSLLSASRTSVWLRLNVRDLEQSAEGRALLRKFQGEGYGDWGGPWYPIRELSRDDVMRLLPVLNAIAQPSVTE